LAPFLLKSFREKISDDVRRLNDDLSDMGLVAIDTSDIWTAKAVITKQNSIHNNHDIRWQYVSESICYTLPDGTTHRYNNKLSYIHVEYSFNGNLTSARFKSIEEIFKNESINKALIALYTSK